MTLKPTQVLLSVDAKGGIASKRLDHCESRTANQPDSGNLLRNPDA
jgi:hypothetical protein